MAKKKSLRTRAKRDELVTKNLGLAPHMVKKLQKACYLVSRMEFDDAHQIALVALVRAAELWDPSQGTGFATYACVSIGRQLIHYSRMNNLIHVPLNVQYDSAREVPDDESGRQEYARRASSPHSLDALESPNETLAVHDDHGEVDDRDEIETIQKRANLSERDRLVVNRRIGYCDSLGDVSAVLGVTRQRVQQIQVAALAKMRKVASC